MTLAPYKTQLDLVDAINAAPRFDGADVTPVDGPRLKGQLDKILALMADHRWRTLRAISAVTDAPEASVSAQLRNARKPRFGSHTVERRHLGEGLYEYRLVTEVAP
jgi:hypothetical protein